MHDFAWLMFSLHCVQNETCKVAEFPGCHCKELEIMLCVSQKFGQVGVSY